MGGLKGGALKNNCEEGICRHPNKYFMFLVRLLIYSRHFLQDLNKEYPASRVSSIRRVNKEQFIP